MNNNRREKTPTNKLRITINTAGYTIKGQHKKSNG